MTLSVNNEYENIYFDLCQIESRLRIVRFPLDHSAGAVLWLFGYSVEILAGDSHVHSVNQPCWSLKIAEAVGCHHCTLLPYSTESFTDDSQSLVRLSFQAWFQSCTEIPRPLQSTTVLLKVFCSGHWRTFHLFLMLEAGEKVLLILWHYFLQFEFYM